MLENIDPAARIFIIDYRLDMYNGLEVIEKVRTTLPHCYFIMLSGMKNYAIVEEFCNSVIRGKYVTKGQKDTKTKVLKFVQEFIEDMQLMETFYRSQAELMKSVDEIKKIIKKDK
jgi:two-component SAPR family response regulator